MVRCTLSFCRRFVCGILGCCLVVSAGTAVADSKAAKSAPASKAEAKAKTPTAEEAMMAEMMKYSTPGEQHKALEPLVGTFKATIKMWMGPGEPQMSEGTCERSWIMGGRYLLGKHAGVMAGMPFEGMEIVGYDIRTGQYVSTWIDNMGTGIAMTTSGKMDSATKTIVTEMPMFDPMVGGMVPYKNITKIVDPNTNVFTMSSNQGGKDVTMMEATYTRVK